MDKITQEQIRYVMEHINDRPRTKVAEGAGISLSAVYRIVRKHGGDMLYERARRSPRVVEIVKKYYASMSGHEIGRKFGISPGRVNTIARQLGLKHSPETLERLKRENAERARTSRAKIDWSKMARRWKTLRRLDEMRVWEGKPQQTKFKLKSISRKSYLAKWYLIKRYNYFAVEGEPYTLC